jgi:VIT1/CCC1 family predicted Fe2+/Mn2+ transporter
VSKAPIEDKGGASLASKEKGTKDSSSAGKQSNPSKPVRELHGHIKGRGLISNIALGLSDGLVTNIAFLAGFGGAVSDIGVIRFAGLAAMLAGSISMFFGGLLAGRSEHDLYEADLAREKSEIESEPEEEKEELRSLYLDKGLTKQEADIVVRRITADKGKWLEDLLAQEVHIHRTELENPLKIALAIGLAFMAGAFVPLVPYLLLTIKSQALISSIILSLVFLLGSGYWKGQLVGRGKWKSGLEMLAIGAIASSILYLIGIGLHVFV